MREMVRITRVHTGKGDKGNTSHLDGTRISKGDLRLEVIGTIDELNSIIGIVKMEMKRMPITTEDGGPRATVMKVQTHGGKKLTRIQNELFDLGAECSANADSIPKGLKTIQNETCELLVTEMDEWSEVTEPLTAFILQSGNSVVANLHLARAISRRAERRLASLRDKEGEGSVREELLSYVNRLSDWLFVMSRWVTSTLGEEETLWIPDSIRNKKN